MKRVAILHYAGPPTVGGVEATIAYHARGLADLGYAVRVISGCGAAFDERVDTLIDPLLASTHPEVLKVKADLDTGNVTSEFWALVDKLRIALREALSDCDVCIAHNVLTLHKNLALSMALLSPNSPQKIPIVAWCHDLAWTNEQYLADLHTGSPWDILRQRWPDVRYVTVSEPRRIELAKLLGIAPEQIAVVVPGVDPHKFFRWTPTMKTLADKLRLLDADGVLLLPSRITRRKNVEMGLRILGEIRDQTGQDFRLIITGPPGPHNPANPGYLGELLALRSDLVLEDAAHFLYSYGENEQPLILDEDTIANLYQIADGLLFPSVQEGFGIPVLEAGLASLPVFCADIPSLRHTGQGDAHYFDPVHGNPRQIAMAVAETFHNSPTYRLRVRVRQEYRWDVLIRDRVVPLVEGL
jgi:glycosyltransferase involved in cell wall biosynthesis